jgi:hypothetical protein
MKILLSCGAIVRDEDLLSISIVQNEDPELFFQPLALEIADNGQLDNVESPNVELKKLCLKFLTNPLDNEVVFKMIFLLQLRATISGGMMSDFEDRIVFDDEENLLSILSNPPFNKMEFIKSFYKDDEELDLARLESDPDYFREIHRYLLPFIISPIIQAERTYFDLNEKEILNNIQSSIYLKNSLEPKDIFNIFKEVSSLDFTDLEESSFIKTIEIFQHHGSNFIIREDEKPITPNNLHQNFSPAEIIEMNSNLKFLFENNITKTLLEIVGIHKELIFLTEESMKYLLPEAATHYPRAESLRNNFMEATS